MKKWLALLIAAVLVLVIPVLGAADTDVEPRDDTSVPELADGSVVIAAAVMSLALAGIYSYFKIKKIQA